MSTDRHTDDVTALYALAKKDHTYLDKYRLCGTGCTPPDPKDGSCKNERNCTDKKCACHLFARKETDPPQNPDSWKHKADPGKPHAPREGYVYRCFCVEPPAKPARTTKA